MNAELIAMAERLTTSLSTLLEHHNLARNCFIVDAMNEAAAMLLKMAEQKPVSHVQPTIKDPDGILRFKENAIVRHLYDWARERGHGLNELACMPFSNEDRQQFAQLLGYSLSGYSELPYVGDDV